MDGHAVGLAARARRTSQLDGALIGELIGRLADQVVGALETALDGALIGEPIGALVRWLLVRFAGKQADQLKVCWLVRQLAT